MGTIYLSRYGQHYSSNSSVHDNESKGVISQRVSDWQRHVMLKNGKTMNDGLLCLCKEGWFLKEIDAKFYSTTRQKR